MSHIADIAADLMRFRTTAENTKEMHRCIDYIKNFLSGTGAKFRVLTRNNKPSLLILFKDTKKPQLFLNGHADVVPASDAAFEPRIEKNVLHGRGAIDMKGQIAAMLLVMREISRLRPRPSVGFMITFDEETGGDNGTKQVLSQGYGCDVALVPDAGDNWSLVSKTKGILWLKITAKGKEAHGSRPWEGKNALEQLIAAAANIKQFFPNPSARQPWKTTANISKMSSGDAVNKTPATAEMTVDIRYTEQHTPKQLLQKIRAAAKGCAVEIAQAGPSFHTDVSHPLITAFRKKAESVLKRKVSTGYEHGGIDARFFTEKNIPVIVFRPLGKNLHTEGEQADIRSLEQFHIILKEFILENIRRE